jgi:Fe-coproporphyrin III synthase
LVNRWVAALYISIGSRRRTREQFGRCGGAERSRTSAGTLWLGYRAVAFSGGEPLIYPGLQQALRRAKALGLRTSVTTNGTLLDPPRLEALRDLVGLLAISLDGPPDLHNEIRGSSSAFDRLITGIENLRSTGIRFGFIHTLTRTSWEHLVWLADFAHDNGASLLQIHPLELFGRAKQEMQSQAMTEDVLARAYLLSFALMAKYKGRMTVQLDVLHREQALRSPASVYAGDCWEGVERASDQLGVIVLESDGSVVPLAYGAGSSSATSTKTVLPTPGRATPGPITRNFDGSVAPRSTRLRRPPCRNCSIGMTLLFVKA